jgi:GNAT superfamily N-acetyltransferase
MDAHPRPRTYAAVAGRATQASMNPRLSPTTEPVPRVVAINTLAEAGQLKFGDLSAYFNPFLDHFVREALRGKGEVWVAQEGSTVGGLLIYNVEEKVGSIFARHEAQADTLFALHDPAAIFSEFPLGAKPETYHVYAAELPSTRGPHRFAHKVRMAREEDQPSIVRMMREMYGGIDTSWLQTIPRGSERCFVVPVAGEIAGAGWVSVVNGHGRLHSLSVRPRYRRAGIGTDLWHARMMWAARAGARQVLSEISEHNVDSSAIATAGGMHRVGRLFLSVRSGGGPAPSSRG